jgi:hypothetical protein
LQKNVNNNARKKPLLFSIRTEPHPIAVVRFSMPWNSRFSIQWIRRNGTTNWHLRSTYSIELDVFSLTVMQKTLSTQRKSVMLYLLQERMPL